MTEATIVPYTELLKVPGPLDYRDVRKNTQLVKLALKEVMIENVDYGKIPGCGDKPGLFKPGAEKLGLMFKLGCFPEVKNESENPDIIKYLVKTKVVHLPTGIEMCVGVGCASTDEEKYKWRKAKQKAEFEATPDDRKRIKYDYNTTTEQVRQNPADVENTVLKMAAKRSMVDAIIKATAATDIFNQGEDDIIIDIEESRNAPKKPQAKTDVKPEETKVPDNSHEPALPNGYKLIVSKFKGTCKGCNQETAEGSKIIFNPNAKGMVYHPDCLPVAK